MIARWPGRARGVHRAEFPEFGAVLDVVVGEAGEALAGWGGKADAWFLDGFAPALNPQMWRDELMALAAARSQPGARAATFTVAGAVRRALSAAGFAVEKKPGFGAKRERLEARLPGAPPAERAPPAVAVIGAGIAGASAARALRALGVEPLLIEAERPGAGGSGNPGALVTPRLDAGLGPPAELYATTYRRAVRLYGEHPDWILARGVGQRIANDRDPARFAKLAASDLFEPGSLVTEDRGLIQTEALVIEPALALAAWGGEPRIARVHALARDDGHWVLRDGEDREIARAEAVIVAAALASAAIAPGLPLSPVRGQASWVKGALSPPPAAWGGYVLPIRGGVLFGATHDEGDAAIDLRPQDHRRNLETLAKGEPGLAARLAEAPWEGRAAIRATTSDRLPMTGPWPRAGDGLFALAGFGSRGFCFAPLLAEHVAALALGAPSPLPLHLQSLVDPGRFAVRAARRGRS
jgi:tRNA 5-methylaminomethyl-2-thiouridine biosynthesis bifunctional protein